MIDQTIQVVGFLAYLFIFIVGVGCHDCRDIVRQRCHAD